MIRPSSAVGDIDTIIPQAMWSVQALNCFDLDLYTGVLTVLRYGAYNLTYTNLIISFLYPLKEIYTGFNGRLHTSCHTPAIKTLVVVFLPQEEDMI